MNYSKKTFVTTVFLMVFSVVSLAQNLELKDIWASGKFRTNTIANFKTLNDGKRFVKLENNEINVYDFKTGKKTSTLVSNEDLVLNRHKTVKIESFIFNSDETKILIETEKKQIYRHSYESIIYVLDLKTKAINQIFGDPCRYPTFSPDGNYVAAVTNVNSILVQRLNDGFMYSIGDGGMDWIINGAVDWVYEEEFSMSRAYEWSPDSKKIAFLTFDSRYVPDFNLEFYEGKPYPEVYSYKYPKAGERNSMVSVKTFDFASIQTQTYMSTEGDDSYIPRIEWAGDNNYLYFQKLNRHQNHLEIWKIKESDGSISIVFEEDNDYYIDLNDKLYFDKSGDVFLYLSEKSGYNHIYQYNTLTKKNTAITNGNYDVDEIVFFDSEKQIVYYTSAEETPLERQLYKIEINKKKKTQITKEKGWHKITFYTGGMFYMDAYSTFNTPTVYTLYDNSGKVVRILESNEKLQQNLKNENLGKNVFGQLTTDNGDKLNYWQILPPDFKPEKRYPVLFYVYGGPGSQTVKNSWGGANYLWFNYLAQKGYIVMSVDNRGTGFRGEKFKKCTYLNLGKLEIEDQIASAKWMAKQTYTDSTRIGIWGWSYGGFMSSLGITLGNDVFKTAIAVAPVTNWKFYDNIYTERFMRTPMENKEGYEYNAPLTHVDMIKGNYLLIHGMADDNVHPQHAMEMINAMIEKNIQYESEFYPNKNHGIYGGMTRLHLFNRITNFILEKL